MEKNELIFLSLSYLVSPIWFSNVDIVYSFCNVKLIVSLKIFHYQKSPKCLEDT